MAHVRKMIRKVLDDMGIENKFQVCDESMRGYHEGEPLLVIIQDWEPNRNAIELKKRIQCCNEDGCIDVIFELKGPCRKDRRRSMPAKKLSSKIMA
jgi:hypothetical protein